MRLGSPDRTIPVQARIAGGLYLVVIAGGLFAEAFVRQGLTVGGDPAATARAIAANEPLWRAGIAVHLLYLPAAVVVNVILYRVFSRIEPTLAVLAVAFSLIALAVEAVSLLLLLVPLATIREGDSLVGFDIAQQQALGYLAAHLFSGGFGIALTFFAFFCVLTGALIIRSRLVPRLIGALMLLAGTCYLVSSVTALAAPALSDRLVPWILMPAFVGELSLATWLLVRGMRLSAWRSATSLPASGAVAQAD